jgi:hypothetical protein
VEVAERTASCRRAADFVLVLRDANANTASSDMASIASTTLTARDAEANANTASSDMASIASTTLTARDAEANANTASSDTA